MAEFALIVPVFLLLFVGITGFGQGFYYWIKANHQANETARWAAVDRNPYGVSLQQHVTDEIGNSLGTNVCISFQDDNPGDGLPGVPTVGNYLTVKVEKPLTFKIHLPLIPALDTGFTIRGTSTQRIESMGSLTAPTSFSTANNIGTCP
jgi:hypothetical protein